MLPRYREAIERIYQILAVVLAWLAASVVTQIGIPAIDPVPSPQPRPLETLGVMALCLPASLSAALLRDRLPWLTTSSPRGAFWLRVVWLVVVTAPAHGMAALWLLTIPDNIPKGHVFAVWLLVLALSILCVTAVGSDLAVLLPFIGLAPFSIPGVAPFEHNIIYNLERSDELPLIALLTMSIAIGWFVAHGARRPDARA